jgi:hypothetical protein
MERFQQMKKIFKRISMSALCVILCLGFSSCGEKHYGNYNDSYIDGYNEGVTEAQDMISGYAEECFNNIDSENKKERGISTEDAVQILTRYADGEPITEAELHDAIWSIHKFYYDAWDIVFELDDYSIN